MGRSHAISGAVVWLAGCATASALGGDPAAATIVVGAVTTAGAALLPDIDHPGSTVARSLGPLTRLVAYGTNVGATALRDATCGCCTRKGGHRAITHTLAFALAAGLLVSLLGWAGGQTAALIVVGAMAALSVRCMFRRRSRGAFGAFGAGLVAAAAAAFLPGPAGWWWIGVPVGLGCLIHTGGDALTFSRVPLLWPLRLRGCRWAPVGMWGPLRFRTGSGVELWLVVPAMLAAGALSVYVLGWR